VQVIFPDGTKVIVHDVIILARLSKKARGRAQTGIYSQDEDARDWAEDEGFNVAATVADHATGTKAMWDRQNAGPWVKQPDLKATYQGIVVSKHDRLTRADWRDESDIRRWAEDNHKVLFLTEQDLRWPPRDANDRQRWNNEAEQSRREWEGTSRRYKRMVRYRNEHNYLAGRPVYGYRNKGVNCGESPCVCWERDRAEDFKTAEIYEPEAKVVREAKDRYLAGESLQTIVNDFSARQVPSPMWQGKPGKKWHVNTLSRLLRNPAIAGRRMNNWNAKTEKERKTVLHYDGIITWDEHGQLIARLDSRANRKGISPSNVKMLTGTLVDEAGHPMYAITGHRTNSYYCRTCKGLMIPVKDADGAVSDAVIVEHGELPHMVKRVVPGKNHFEEIERLRRDRDELDDTKADYFEQSKAITIEIQRLIKLDEEHPQPDAVKWVPDGKTVRQYWDSLDNVGRRDWLRDNGWKVTGLKQPADIGGWSLEIDAGETAGIGIERQAMSLGSAESPEDIARDAYARTDAIRSALAPEDS
jgi:site-specific DNA recombinase